MLTQTSLAPSKTILIRQAALKVVKSQNLSSRLLHINNYTCPKKGLSHKL